MRPESTVEDDNYRQAEPAWMPHRETVIGGAEEANDFSLPMRRRVELPPLGHRNGGDAVSPSVTRLDVGGRKIRRPLSAVPPQGKESDRPRASALL